LKVKKKRRKYTDQYVKETVSSLLKSAREHVENNQKNKRGHRPPQNEGEE